MNTKFYLHILLLLFPRILISQQNPAVLTWEENITLPVEIRMRENKTLVLDIDGDGADEWLFLPKYINEDLPIDLNVFVIKSSNSIEDELSTKKIWDFTVSIPSEIRMRENEILISDLDGDGKEELFFLPQNLSEGLPNKLRLFVLELDSSSFNQPKFKVKFDFHISLPREILVRDNEMMLLDSDGDGSQELVFFPKGQGTYSPVDIRIFGIETSPPSSPCSFIFPDYDNESCPVAEERTISMNNQAQIDNFSLCYQNCTTIEGHLSIEGNDITNLMGLRQLEFIKGDLIVKGNPLLNSLSGLENLKEIELNLEISNNEILSNLMGLRQLEFIKGDLIVKGNPLLNSLSGLENLKEIELNLEISNNEILSDLEVLSNIERIGRDIDVRLCPQLTEMPVFNNLQTIGRSLILLNNVSLNNLSNLSSIEGVVKNVYLQNLAVENLNGLQNLRLVGGDFRLESNTRLESIQELSNLASIGSLTILSNNSLVSLTGIENINLNETNKIQIRENSNLSNCALDNLCEAINNEQIIIDIISNSDDCEGIESLKDECERN